MADVPKLVEELWSLTLLEAIELAEILKKKWRPPEVSLADIKRYLPHWPDAVIELWLFYLANRSAGDTGWPPPEPLGNHAWAAILDTGPFHGGERLAGSAKRLTVALQISARVRRSLWRRY
jgi:hypothetical protein